MQITRWVWLLFVLDSIANLISELLDSALLNAITKPLLMPLLLAWLLVSTSSKVLPRFRNFMITGLIFATAGDVLLLLSKQFPVYFILGLVGFVIMQGRYIGAFLSYPQSRRGLVFRQPLYILPFLIFLIAYNILLFPRIEANLHFAIIFYSTLLVAMAIYALNLRSLVTPQAGNSLFGGALLFVASDSLLAFNKFYDPTAIPYAGFFIMLTYILGQYFIVKGTIRILQIAK